MTQLSILVLILGFLFYVGESSTEEPSIFKICVYACAVIEGSLCLALR